MSKTKKPENPTRIIYQCKVTLRHSKPPIWRRFQVDGDVTLRKLHRILQVVMGWTNSHLHQFCVRGVDFSDPAFELEHAENESRTRLSSVALREGVSFVYEYDFGDGWEHEVRVEKLLPPEQEGRFRPLCLTGKRACPPEDVGGIGGYEDFLEAIRDPKHENHDEMVEWIGGDWDPEAFDLEVVNDDLKHVR